MLKYVLSLALAIGCVHGATISTGVSCGFGFVGSSGGTSSICSSGLIGSSAEISANAAYEGFIPGNFGQSSSVDILATGVSQASSPFYDQQCPLRRSCSSDANFSDTYILTVTGGSGTGTLYPCLFVSNSALGVPPSSSETASASFGGITISGTATSLTTCSGRAGTLINTQILTFTFGVPQSIEIELSGSEQLVDRSADAFRSELFGLFFSAPCFPGYCPAPQIQYSLISVDLPEPSSWSMLGLGLTFFIAAAIRRTSRL